MFVTGGEPIQTKDWSGWTAVAVADGATVAIELRKAAGATLRGVVRENGEPVAGARVTFVEGLPRDRPPTREEQLRDVMTRGGLSATTAADGSFELVDLPAGAHRVRIAAPHRAMASTRDVQLVVGENATVVDLDVTSVQGVVRDPAGAPVSGARLSILPEPSAGGGRELQDAIRAAEMLRGEGGGGNRVTDDSGAFTLRGVVPGARFRLRAAAKGFAPATSDVLEVAAGQTRTGVELRLCAGGTIEVTHSDATARVHVQARALDADGKPDPAVPPVSLPMREGAVKLDGLRPGRWVVTARAMTDPSSRNERTVEVAAGATTHITF
jgi:hypothetical protein